MTTLDAIRPFDEVTTENIPPAESQLFKASLSKAEPEWLRNHIAWWVNENDSYGPISEDEMWQLGSKSFAEEGTDWVLIFTDSGMLRRDSDGYWVTDIFLKRAHTPYHAYDNSGKQQKSAANPMIDDYHDALKNSEVIQKHNLSYHAACAYATITRATAHPRFMDSVDFNVSPIKDPTLVRFMTEILNHCIAADEWSTIDHVFAKGFGGTDALETLRTLGMLEPTDEDKVFIPTDRFARLCLYLSEHTGVFTGARTGPIVTPFEISIDAFKEHYPASPEFKILQAS